MSHIFLYGPPGTGKSTIGRILARNLKLPFIDLDLIIKTSAGMSIPEIMHEQGEPAFRDIETSALQGLINEKESVIASAVERYYGTRIAPLQKVMAGWFC